jgi:hypothetical protein
MSTNMMEPEGPQMTSQYGAYALRAGLARLRARMRVHTPTLPCTHMHERTQKQAHTDQRRILIAFPEQHWLRERASVLRYTYIVFLRLCSVGEDERVCRKHWWSDTDRERQKQAY